MTFITFSCLNELYRKLRYNHSRALSVVMWFLNPIRLDTIANICLDHFNDTLGYSNAVVISKTKKFLAGIRIKAFSNTTHNSFETDKDGNTHFKIGKVDESTEKLEVIVPYSKGNIEEELKLINKYSKRYAKRITKVMYTVKDKANSSLTYKFLTHGFQLIEVYQYDDDYCYQFERVPLDELGVHSKTLLMEEMELNELIPHHVEVNKPNLKEWVVS